MSGPVNPGDVLVVGTDSWVGRIIRLGELFSGGAHGANHVAVAHHYDDSGVLWGVEGRPGGVGWVDLRIYFDQYHVTNVGQSKSVSQRRAITDNVQQLLGRAYDWVGIAADACRDLNFPALFAQNWKGKGTPGHLVCSSLAAYVYQHVGLAHPDGGRFCQPSDWEEFILKKEWQ